MTSATRTCSDCRVMLTPSNSWTKSSYCKPHHIARRKKWAEDNPSAQKRHNRRAQLKRYGLTPDDYERLRHEQFGACAICGLSEKRARWSRLDVDHCHDSGEVRGLLCGNCNRALGLLDHDPLLLKSAVKYLTNKS